MSSYLEMPEALDFIAGQAWLSPAETTITAPPDHPRRQSGPRPLGWRDALREIASIIGRMRPT